MLLSSRYHRALVAAYTRGGDEEFGNELLVAELSGLLSAWFHDAEVVTLDESMTWDDIQRARFLCAAHLAYRASVVWVSGRSCTHPHDIFAAAPTGRPPQVIRGLLLTSHPSPYRPIWRIPSW